MAQLLIRGLANPSANPSASPQTTPAPSHSDQRTGRAGPALLLCAMESW